MLTERARSRVTRPSPPHAVQGFSMTWPRPWQDGQVRSRVKKPWAWRILPWPPQVAHTLGLVPDWAPLPVQDSQVTEVGILIWAFRSEGEEALGMADLALAAAGRAHLGLGAGLGAAAGAGFAGDRGRNPDLGVQIGG